MTKTAPQTLFITANRIGDALLSTALLKYMLERTPDMKTTVVTGPAPAPLFQYLPGLSRLIIVQKQPYHLHWVRLWQETVGTRWDQVIDLRGSLLASFLSARTRLKPPRHRPGDHQLTTLARIVGQTSLPGPCLFLDASHQTEKQKPAMPPILALGIGANWRGKIWPLERFIELTKGLCALPELSDAQIALLGDANDQNLINEFKKNFAENFKDRTIIDLSAHDLLASGAFLKQARLCISNDSGAMHLSAAAGCPTLGLFGPSDETRYGPFGPYGDSVRGPRSFKDIIEDKDFYHRSGQSYMLDLSVEHVHNAAHALLKRTARWPKN